MEEILTSVGEVNGEVGLVDVVPQVLGFVFSEEQFVVMVHVNHVLQGDSDDLLLASKQLSLIVLLNGDLELSRQNEGHFAVLLEVFQEKNNVIFAKEAFHVHFLEVVE